MTIFQHSFSNTNKISYFFAQCAVRSLYYEVALFPKPGLVSFIDNGAHKDMDGALFHKSLFSLRHYFYHICQKSIAGDSQKSLVKLAIETEKTLLELTNGVNTHRGAIFALGIMCASIATLSQKKATFTPNELQQHIIEMWTDYLTHQHQNDKRSNGEKIREKYGEIGAKKMAMQGYAVVFEVLQQLSHLTRSDRIYFGLKAYCLLLLKIDDTNILYRTGMNGLIYAREQIAPLLAMPTQPLLINHAIRLHDDFSNKNISPGGVADMLGLLYFLKQLF